MFESVKGVGMVSFRDVIRAALRERRLSARALALMVDISQQYASQIMRGEKIPSDEVVLRIADVLGLDRRELLMLAHREKAPPEAKPFFDPSPRVELAARRLRIPVISYVSAGVPFQWTDQGFPPGAGMDYIVMDRTLLPGVHPDEAESCYAVKVRGDSMSPFLRDGDVLVARPGSWAQVRNWDLVIYKDTDYNAWVKLVEFQGDDLILHSMSPMYPPMRRPKKETVLLDRVIVVLKI